MTKPGYAHYIEVLDRSGSMGSPSEPGSPVSKAEVATKGMNDFNASQAALPGKATFTLWQFDDMSIDRLAHFADSYLWTCVPRGGTPLLDAMGMAIVSGGEDLAALPEGERPERVYVVAATDGLENSSREYTNEQLRALVERQTQQYQWEFVYIGADIDAFAAAGAMGVAAAGTLNTNSANAGAMAAAYAGTRTAVTRSRAAGQSVSYSGAERQAAQEGTP